MTRRRGRRERNKLQKQRHGGTEERRAATQASHRQRPMPARPSAGPSNQSTPRGRKRPVLRVPLVSVGCRFDRPPRERRHRRTR